MPALTRTTRKRRRRSPWRTACLCAGLGIAGFVAYAMLAPSQFAPLAWQAPKPPVPASLPTSPVPTLEKLSTMELTGPEFLEMDAAHQIYAGFLGGEIVRFAADGSQPQRLAQTKGRPLGIRVQRDGRLLVADAERGLLQVDKDGSVKVLADHFAGQALRLVDDLALSADEKSVYFTEASHKFDTDDSALDIIEHGGNGRIFHYDMVSGELSLVRDGLNFANGIVFGPGEDNLLVNETGSYRVIRVYVRGPKAGTTEVFADNLPGLPDNITLSANNHVWVALFAPRNRLLDALSMHPKLRQLLLTLPAFLRPQPELVGQAVCFDLDGHMLKHIEMRGKDAYAPITTAREADGWLYFGSLVAPGMARTRLL